MKKFSVLKKSRTMKAKFLAMLVIGCSVISQFTSIPAYAGTYSDINIALGKTATASSSCSDELPSKAVDGTYSNNSDKWCTGAVGGEKWLKLDLGDNYNINRWVVYHAGVAESNYDYNTRDFRLQKSDDGMTWYDIDIVVQNTNTITERTISTFNTRYVRLYIDCGQKYNNDVARIYEFQLFCDEEVNLALKKPVTVSKELGFFQQFAPQAVNGTYIDEYDKWCTGWASGEPKWLTVDLGKAHAINRWKVVHAGVHEKEDYNTRNFRLQASSDGVYWRDIDVVYDNTSSITDRTFYYFARARYFRLWIDQSTQYDDSCARIYEFELYEHPSYSGYY